MHLVAAGPRSISAGPSNYISGVNGKPQDTVVFVGCVDAAGNQNGSAYMGLPAFTMRVVKGHYEFAKRFVIKNVRLLDAASAASITATVTLSGTAIPGSSSTGAIRGTLRVSAPGCLSRTLVLPYTGA